MNTDGSHDPLGPAVRYTVQLELCPQRAHVTFRVVTSLGPMRLP